MKSDKAQDLVRSYTCDQFAAVRHVGLAIDNHIASSSIEALNDAKACLHKIRETLRGQEAGLKAMIDSVYGGAGIEGEFKSAVTTVSGFIAGIYGQLRSETASRMLRDDVTALHFLCTTYSMLLSTALSLEENDCAMLAAKYLHQLTPQVVELGYLVPVAVMDELNQEGFNLSTTAKAETLRTFRDAWSGHHTELM